MPGDEAIQRAMQLFGAGDKVQAREILKGVLRADRDNCMAWALMVQVAENRQEAIFSLKQVLRLKPGDAWAKKKLESFEQPASPPAPAPQPVLAVAMPEKAVAAPAIETIRPVSQSEPRPPAPQAQTDIKLAGPQWMIEAVEAGRTLLRPSLTSTVKKQEGLSKSTTRLIVVGVWVLIVGVIAIILYAIWREEFATQPGDQQKVLQAAHDWVAVSYTFDYTQMQNMTCDQYRSSPETDLFISLLAKRMGVDPKAAASKYKVEPPKNLQYTVVSLGGSHARIRVVGFLDDFKARYGSQIPLDENMYKQLNENVYVMKREGGQWKWCGREY